MSATRDTRTPRQPPARALLLPVALLLRLGCFAAHDLMGSNDISIAPAATRYGAAGAGSAAARSACVVLVSW